MTNLTPFEAKITCKPARKRKHSFDSEKSNLKLSYPPPKRSKTFSGTTICHLPNEIMLEIFSYVPKRYIFENVRFVCSRWNQLANDSILWDTIDIDKSTPLKLINKWLTEAGRLKHFFATGRSDTDYILNRICKRCKKLESLKLVNCSGTCNHWTVDSRLLCNIMERCSHLNSIHFHNISFKSCKFFKLLAEKSQLKKVCYSGPITRRQFTTCTEYIEKFGTPSA